jgi:hypothetical protein
MMFFCESHKERLNTLCGRMQGIFMLQHAVYVLRYHEATECERSI